jgi:hypothetical protein
MKDPVGDVIVLDEIEDLGFVDVTGIGLGVKDAVPVEREALPVAGQNFFLLILPDGLPAETSVGRQPFPLFFVEPES